MGAFSIIVTDRVILGKHCLRLYKAFQTMEEVLVDMGLGLRTDVKSGTKAKYQGKDHLHSILNKTKMKKPLNMRPDRIDRYRHLVELDLSGCCQEWVLNVTT